MNGTIYKTTVVAVTAAAGLSFWCGGCAAPNREDCSQRYEQLQTEYARLQKQYAVERHAREELERQVNTLQNLPADRGDYLVRVAAVELGRFTGGYDADRDGTDDGIKVYLVLRDRRHDVIKAAGWVRLELWNLDAPAGERLLVRREYDPPTLADHWLAGLLANHYKFDIPWPDDHPPLPAAVTVKVVFTDALQGKSFTAQRLVPIQ